MNDDHKGSNWDFEKILNQLLVVIAIGVLGHLAYALYANDLQELKTFVNFHPLWLVIGYCSMIAIWIVHGAEIYIWAHLFQKKLSFHDGVKIGMATDLGVAATPTFVGGGPIKVSMLMKKGFRSDQAATILAMNPIADILFFLWFIPGSIWLGRKRYDAFWILDYFNRASVVRSLLIFLGVIILFFLIRRFWKKGEPVQGSKITWRHRILDLFKRIGENFRFIAREGKWHFLACVLFTSMKWVFRFAALVALVKALGVEADLLTVFLFQWMVYVLMMFFPTPGASGGAEFIFHTVFRSVIPLIDITMLAWRFLTYYITMITAAGYLLFVRWRTGKII